MKTVRPLPSATSVSAAATTRRMPKRSISAAANGAVSPYSTRFTETAAEMLARDQPKSSCSGSIRIDGAARKLAAPTRARKATTATNQAGWMRGTRPPGMEIVVERGGAISELTAYIVAAAARTPARPGVLSSA